MTLSRWLSLVIAVIYVVVFVSAVFMDKNPDKNIDEELFHLVTGLLLWLGFSLVLIWYGNDLGEGLTGAKWGWIDAPSPGWAIQLFGWLFLLAPAVLYIWKLLEHG